MKRIPKKRSLSSGSKDDEHVWDELEAPPSLDAAEDGEMAGRADEVRVVGKTGEKLVRDGDGKARARRSWISESSVMQIEIQHESPLPPDVRLSIKDLKVEGAGEQPDARPKSWSSSARWVLAAGLVVMAALILSMSLLARLNKSNPKVNPLGVAPMVIEQEEEYPKGEHIADLLARKDEARSLFGRFLAAKSAEDVLGMVRPVPGLETLVARSRRPEGWAEGWKVPEDVKWDVHTDQDPVFGVLSGYDPDDRKFQAFFTLEKGRLLLDWKATVGYCSVPFSSLAGGEGDASEVRVWVEPASFYSVSFPESEYRAFKIYTTLDDPAVWAFARRGGVPEQELARMFHKSMFGDDRTKASMVVLSLARGAADTAPNQWEIAELLHRAWILP